MACLIRDYIQNFMNRYMHMLNLMLLNQKYYLKGFMTPYELGES